jgi:hypothetical protein
MRYIAVRLYLRKCTCDVACIGSEVQDVFEVAFDILEIIFKSPDVVFGNPLDLTNNRSHSLEATSSLR